VPALDPATVTKMICPKQPTNKVDIVDLSSQTDKNRTHMLADPGENSEKENDENKTSYATLETPIEIENLKQKSNQSMMNCKLERRQIYRKMWKSLLIKNNLQNTGRDLGEESSELRDGLKLMSRI